RKAASVHAAWRRIAVGVPTHASWRAGRSNTRNRSGVQGRFLGARIWRAANLLNNGAREIGQFPPGFDGPSFNRARKRASRSDLDTFTGLAAFSGAGSVPLAAFSGVGSAVTSAGGAGAAVTAGSGN